MDKQKHVNYRKFYEKYYNIKIPDGFVIHHLDGDRKNNDIHNLLMLPKKLHSQYHYCKSHFNGMNVKIMLDNSSDCFVLRKYADVLEDCKYYAMLNYRMDMGVWLEEINGR